MSCENSLNCGDKAQLGAVERSSGKLCQRTVDKPLTSDSATACRSADTVRRSSRRFSAVERSSEWAAAPTVSRSTAPVRRPKGSVEALIQDRIMN